MNEQQLSKIEDIFPMSDIEKGMVYHYLNSNDVLIYHNQMVHQVEIKKFESPRMKRALELMVEKHPILRTCYNVEDLSDFAHIVYKKIELCYKYYDISHMSVREQEDHISNYLEEDKKSPLDITTPPLWRMAVFQIDEDFVCILWTCHHALLDGWSCASFFTELNRIYNALKDNNEFKPNMLKASFKEFITEQIIENKKEANSEFWKNELAGFKRLDFFNNSQNDMKRSLYRHSLGKDFLVKLKNAAVRYNTSVKNLCAAAYIFSLYMLSYEDDITVGILTHCRPVCEDGEKILGCFLNTVPLRIKISANITWGEYVKLVDNKLLEIARHEKMSLFEISKIASNGMQERKAVFDTLFSYQDFHVIDVPGEDSQYSIQKRLVIRGYDTPYSNTETILNIIVNTTFSEFNVTYSFVNSVIRYGVEEKIPNYFKGVLNKLIHEKDTTINKYDLLGTHEKNMLLQGFNDTYVEYPRNKTIIELFEDKAREVPNKVAIVYQNEQLTYNQLNKRASLIAKFLSREGTQPDMPVAVLLEPSIEMVVGLLAVLKAGAAFLPVDPENPSERIKYILEDSNVHLLLTHKRLQTKVDFAGKTILVDNDFICDEACESMKSVTTPDNLAYIIYTSGTTGKPKGVMINNSSVVNYANWFIKKTGINENDKTALISSYSFDLGYTALFSSLLSGGQLHIVPRDLYLDPEMLLKYISEQQLTYLKMTPSLFSTIALREELNEKECSMLRLIVLGGEKLNISDVESVYKKCSNISIMNHYGPTETTIGTIAQVLSRGDLEHYKLNPVIGRPINNTRIYILDKNLDLLPGGAIGEIFISGDALARGYLNEKELTLEKFIQNACDSNERMYRTGDFGRWLPDGSIEFLGRRDEQVKIRGYRVDLNEIEGNLSKLPEIRQIKVILYKENNENKYLCAYYTSDKEIPANDLRNYLLNKIPEYMIPAFFTRVEAFKLTPNGKLDIKALPKPESRCNNVTNASLDETEKKIIDIWKGILSIKNNSISLDSNFLEIGGHSLNAIKLISKIQKEFKVKIPLMEFFKNPTVRNVVEIIKSKKTNTYSSVKTADKKEYYALSSQQKRLYILQHLNRDSIVYNQPRVITIDGNLDRVRLEETFRILISRHDSYRTCFPIINDEPVQKIYDSVPLNIQYFEYIPETIEDIVNEFIKPFDLSIPPLLRVGIIKVGSNRHVLLIDTHHIISDGISLGIFINELSSIYNGDKSALPKLEYKDYSEWQLHEKNSAEMKKEEEYWLEQFKGNVPALNLPIDFVRPAVQSFEGKHRIFVVSKEDTAKLKDIAVREGVSLYSLMLAIFNIFLSKICDQEDIIVGLPVDGRRNIDFTNTIGMFVNTLAIRNNTCGEKNARAFIKEVGKRMIEALENQGYQFEELVEKIQLQKDTGRNPLFDVMFAMQNFDIPKLQIDGLSNVPYEYKHKTSKFDLSMYFMEQQEEMLFSLEYCTKLFKDETVSRFIEYFRNIISSILGNLDMKICDIDIMLHKEKSKILGEFNDTKVDFPTQKTIHKLFEEQAYKSPDKVAVVHRKACLTYSELNKKANQLARVLHMNNVGTDVPVGIMTERSAETLIAILAILKAGGAYVPISSSYPKDRVRVIIEDSEIGILLTDNPQDEMNELNIIIVDVTDDRNYSGEDSNLDIPCSQENLAYIIYTSGSTGRPKGVMIEHQSVVNLLYSLQKHYPLTGTDTYLLKTSYVFDVSVTELFGWFLDGGRIAVLDAGAEKDPANICGVVSEFNVTHINFVPSMFNAFLDTLDGERIKTLKCLKYIFLAGEELLPEVVHKYKTLGIRASLENLYGPTEGTVYASRYSLADWDGKGKVPIGKPIDNASLYILNKDMKLQPVGMVGELCISGIGVARGYQNCEDLNKDVFSISSFNGRNRIYHTGDLARWLPDGNIEFLGRIDNQVKIRGFRVELGEIENLLLKHREVKDTAVILRNDNNDRKTLCAYVVMNGELNKNELKDYLKEQLPDYMVPSSFIQIDSVPLNQSGKVDRIALTSINTFTDMEEGYIEPLSNMEITLANIWKEVLGVSKVGINTNFFELGGTSLDIIKLSSKFKKIIDIDVPVLSFFEYPTISLLSQYLKREIQNKEEDYKQEGTQELKLNDLDGLMEQTILKWGK